MIFTSVLRELKILKTVLLMWENKLFLLFPTVLVTFRAHYFFLHIYHFKFGIQHTYSTPISPASFLWQCRPIKIELVINIYDRVPGLKDVMQLQ